MPIVQARPIKGKVMVSALIAAYNEELHLDACIQALLNQSYKNLEILIVENGGSKDKTYEIAKKYAARHKNVKAYSIPGKQKGPGNAWNFGVKKAKGDIILIVGADLRYGKNYVKNGIKPIIEGKTVGIVQNVEICNNSHNLWARAFFYRRITTNEKGLSKVFSLIRKDYLAQRPFNSALGYADDQTIYQTEGTEFPGMNLEVYHTNPDSFSDTWDHSVWVGASLPNKKAVIAALPVFPIYVMYKTVQHLRIDFYPPFLLFLPYYYTVRYFAYLTAARTALRTNPKKKTA